MKQLYKQLKVGAIIALDSFKDYKKSFEERYIAALEGDAPIVVLHPDGCYRLLLHQWSGYVPRAVVNVAASDTPTRFGALKRVVVPSDGTIAWDRLPHSRRWFFKLESETGASAVVGERLIPFRGTLNFRDLGGYPTTDGRRVKWGLLYRSDHLRKFRRAEFGYFKRLNIQCLCDFRGNSTVKRFPNKLPRQYIHTRLHLPVESEGLELRELRNRILRNEFSGYDAEKVLINAYAQFIHAPEFQTVLRQLFAGNYPLLVHCSAGKDRTGFISALILALLGVSDEVILADYLASNAFRAKETQKYLVHGTTIAPDLHRLMPLLEVQPSYLLTTLAAIRQQYGSVAQMVATQLNISHAAIDELRDHLLA